ncbi:hypothetical protein LCGC14_0275740 [marine sediment metagenome]|uniref:Uncharacterized protein n=1 Tax=marine sediment metagenome TaxID=412755 RepID=A0A0F9X2U5_9ZZZZ
MREISLTKGYVTLVDDAIAALYRHIWPEGPNA